MRIDWTTSKFYRELIGQLRKLGKDIYLISGGFQSIISPVAKQLDIKDENIFANKLIFNEDGRFRNLL